MESLSDLFRTGPDTLVVIANRQKLKSRPSEIVSLLKGIRNSIQLIQRDREKVLAAAAKKETGSDISILRRSLSFTADTYSISLTRRNIEALLHAAKISRPAGGTEKFFTDDFLLRALGK